MEIMLLTLQNYLKRRFHKEQINIWKFRILIEVVLVPDVILDSLHLFPREKKIIILVELSFFILRNMCNYVSYIIFNY